MKTDRRNRLCRVEEAWTLDNIIRRGFQNPGKILKPYLAGGMTVLDLGCGPGFFTRIMAGMVGAAGRVIAADLQEGMLEKLRQKIRGTDLEDRVVLHKCGENVIGVIEKVDFVLAFHMIHEVPDQDRLFSEIRSILNQGGRFFIAEPVFHVNKEAFETTLEKAGSAGFSVLERPKIFMSRAAILEGNPPSR